MSVDLIPEESRRVIARLDRLRTWALSPAFLLIIGLGFLFTFDGVGHIGGGIGILVLAPLVPHLSVLGALMLISCFLIVASVLAQFTVHTRDRALECISP
jgi:hypothetical protein